MSSLTIRSCLLWAALTIGLASLANAQSGLRTLRNAYFETVGLDLRSVNYVNELTLVTAEISERYLDPQGLAYPLPILVNLRPQEHFEFEGDHLMSLGPRGSVQLDLLWEEPLSLERACYLLTEALLVQYAIFNHGPGAEMKIPIWSISGLSSEVYFRLRPSAFVARVETANSLAWPTAAEILSASPEEPAAGAFGFWMLQALKVSAAERSTVRKLYQLSLTGADISEAVTSVVQSQTPTDDPVALEAWWVAQMQELLAREYEMVESMETTKQWLELLADFSQPIQVGEEALELNLRTLWKHRESEAVRELVGARSEILKLRLVRANPAYYNAAQSLGTLFETLLEEDASFRYIHALTIFLSDWEDAKEMQAVLEVILSE